MLRKAGGGQVIRDITMKRDFALRAGPFFNADAAGILFIEPEY